MSMIEDEEAARSRVQFSDRSPSVITSESRDLQEPSAPTLEMETLATPRSPLASPREGGGSNNSDGIYESISVGEDQILAKFDSLALTDQQELLRKMKERTSQAVLPTSALEEAHSDVELALSDNDERGERIQRAMELSAQKRQDIQDLEKVMRMRIKEIDKQEEQMKHLGRSRGDETKLLKTRDTLERIREGSDREG